MNNSSEVKPTAISTADRRAKTTNGSAMKKGKGKVRVRLVIVPKTEGRNQQSDALITRMSREAPAFRSWLDLAAVIVERALFEDHADQFPPDKAKKLRVSERAVRLKDREREMWEWCCRRCADSLLLELVTDNANGSRRRKLKGVTQLRLREILTHFSSAFIEELRRGYWG
jgi:hypothetical protein